MCSIHVLITTILYGQYSLNQVLGPAHSRQAKPQPPTHFTSTPPTFLCFLVPPLLRPPFPAFYFYPTTLAFYRLPYHAYRLTVASYQPGSLPPRLHATAHTFLPSACSRWDFSLHTPVYYPSAIFSCPLFGHGCLPHFTTTCAACLGLPHMPAVRTYHTAHRAFRRVLPTAPAPALRRHPPHLLPDIRRCLPPPCCRTHFLHRLCALRCGAAAALCAGLLLLGLRLTRALLRTAAHAPPRPPRVPALTRWRTAAAVRARRRYQGCRVPALCNLPLPSAASRLAYRWRRTPAAYRYLPLLPFRMFFSLPSRRTGAPWQRTTF